MGNKVLITGGSGMIGRRLTRELLTKGYEVVHLSRSKNGDQDVPVFVWNYRENYLEDGALDGVESIVHLAGAGVGDKRWTKDRRKVILDSRVETANLLYRALRDRNHKIKAFISASGISMYGHDTGEKVCTEETEANEKDFLGRVSIAWEAAADQFSEVATRVVKLRTGVVLSNRSGAFPRLVTPVRYGAGAAIGSGRQFMSWIHLDDQARLILHCLEHGDIQQVYNAVSTDPVRNRTMMKSIARHLHRPFFLPNVPAFVLKLVFGEMAAVVLGGNKVSGRKILDTGFDLRYPTLEKALNDLLG